MMIKVISFKICPFVQRVTALLEAKKVPYDIEYISLQDKPQWFLDISPNGQVPLLITDSGTVLFESDAIVEYLDDVYKPLEPELTAEQRAIDRAWSYQAAKNYLVQCGAQRSADKDTLAERSEKLRHVFAKAERAISEGPYFKGLSMSNVDIAWLPLLHRAAIIYQHTGYDFLAGFHKVKTWQSALLASNIPQQSISDDFEAIFTQFYLSDSTYLGKGKNCNNDADLQCKEGRCC